VARQKLALLLADDFEIRQVHQIEKVDGCDVVDGRLFGAQPQRLGDFEDRLPQMRVVGDDDPRRRRAQMMHQPQRRIDILEHADGVGDHDVIERSFDRTERGGILDVAQHEMEVRMQLIGLRNGPRAEIDANAVSRRKRGEQIASATAEFQYPLARRDQEAHELEIVFVVGGVEFPPALQFVDIAFEVVDKSALALRGQLKGASSVGRPQIHLDLGGKGRLSV